MRTHKTRMGIVATAFETAGLQGDLSNPRYAMTGKGEDLYAETGRVSVEKDIVRCCTPYTAHSDCKVVLQENKQSFCFPFGCAFMYREGYLVEKIRSAVAGVL